MAETPSVINLKDSHAFLYQEHPTIYICLVILLVSPLENPQNQTKTTPNTTIPLANSYKTGPLDLHHRKKWVKYIASLVVTLSTTGYCVCNCGLDFIYSQVKLTHTHMVLQYSNSIYLDPMTTLKCLKVDKNGYSKPIYASNSNWKQLDWLDGHLLNDFRVIFL